MTTSEPLFAAEIGETAVPVRCVRAEALDEALADLGEAERRFAQAQLFRAEAGSLVLLPDAEGRIARVLFGLGRGAEADRAPLLAGHLARKLPDGLYRLENAPDDRLAALAFALGAYRFDRYRADNGARPRLAMPEGVDGEWVRRTADAVFLARDLINMPANELGPDELCAAAHEVARPFGAEVEIVRGDALASGFPMVHAVGAASDRPPCLIDLTWGATQHPRVTLVGKGVVFDTGGVDIKQAGAMSLMKKDMGGAAHVLALARMVMGAGLPVRLRVLVPAVENAISGRAFRPGDVLRSRKGTTVEIGNTDAEGRLILADALTLADEEAPDLMVSMATLTGAARVALGPDLPAMYTDDDELAGELAAAGAAECDPVWRLPLWRGYDSWLASKVADVSHIANSRFAGSIVAALFLKRFVERARAFLHFDIYAWSQSARPAGPEGGEAQAIRALERLIAERYRRR